MGGRFAAGAAAIAISVAACGSPSTTATSTTTTTTPPTVAPTASERWLAPSTSSSTAAAAACDEAPARVVEMINAAFTNGEHLEHAQAVRGPNAMTFVGGNIYDAAGERVSSEDAWVLSNGAVYALTSDARRRTLLQDGRDLDQNWTQRVEPLGACVSRVARAGQ